MATVKIVLYIGTVAVHILHMQSVTTKQLGAPCHFLIHHSNKRLVSIIIFISHGTRPFSKLYYVKHSLLTIHSLISPIGQTTSKLLAMAQYYSYQAVASQQDSKVKHLNAKIATLEQQLNDTKASKKKLETERESALEEKASTKVCTVQYLYDTCTLSWLVRATQFTVITVVSAM